MVSDEQVIELMLEKFPDFEKAQKEYMALFGEDSGISGNMSAFSHYVIDLIEQNKINKDDLNKIFNFIEELMEEGTDTVKDAVATCFLENIINATSWGAIPASSFVPLLGKKSKEFCKAWDEFTGVKTDGLWDEHK